RHTRCYRDWSSDVCSSDLFNPLVRGEAPEGSLDSVTLCHGEHYVGELRHIAPTSGLIYIDGDTSMSPGTWEAVMRGVGGAVAARSEERRVGKGWRGRGETA